MEELRARIALETHLVYNWGYPAHYADIMEVAISMVNTGEGDEYLPQYTADGVQKTAWEVVSHFRLETFLDITEYVN